MHKYRKIYIEVSVLALFLAMAFLYSNITGMATNTAVVNADVSKATIPCVYLQSPTILEQKDLVYMVSYIENCGNQPMNISVNLTATYKDTILANASLIRDDYSLTDRELILPLVFTGNIPYNPDPRENYINITLTVNYTDYYHKNINGIVRQPRRIFIITKPPLLLKPVDSTGQPKKIDNEVIKELVKNNSIEIVNKTATKGYIETYSNYVQIAKENVSIPLNLSDDLNASDLDICSSNLSYLGEEVFCNITMVKGKTYILHIGYGSVHIYAEEVSDDLIEEIRQQLIEEGALNSTNTIIYSEDSKEVTTIVEKEASVTMMDLDATPHIYLLKNFNYITYIKIKNSGTTDLNNIRINIISALKTNIISGSQINLKPGESINVPVEIVPDLEGNYWLIAEVGSDTTSKKIGINVDIPSDRSSLKESIQSYETLIKDIQANISNYENPEELQSIIDSSLATINDAYKYYDEKDYDKVDQSLSELKDNMFNIISKITNKPLVVTKTSIGTSPAGQFIFSSGSNTETLTILVILVISCIIGLFVYRRDAKCHVCGNKINDYKCALCKRISKDRNHKCGKEHLIPRCSGCKKLEMYCKCK